MTRQELEAALRLGADLDFEGVAKPANTWFVYVSGYWIGEINRTTFVGRGVLEGIVPPVNLIITNLTAGAHSRWLRVKILNHLERL